mmetsp:Transcript_7005/g.16367  ORF Transcript_7005/g.16367 Transcript_7005/m.16367 type:complete len:213 (+) Transcript_7005:1228-1866(+)
MGLATGGWASVLSLETGKRGRRREQATSSSSQVWPPPRICMEVFSAHVPGPVKVTVKSPSRQQWHSDPTNIRSSMALASTLRVHPIIHGTRLNSESPSDHQWHSSQLWRRLRDGARHDMLRIAPIHLLLAFHVDAAHPDMVMRAVALDDAPLTNLRAIVVHMHNVPREDGPPAIRDALNLRLPLLAPLLGRPSSDRLVSTCAESRRRQHERD